MTTTKEFIKWLEGFPEDTIVKVAIKQFPTNENNVFFEDIRVEKCNIGYGWKYVNYAYNKYIKSGDEVYNKKILYLGEK